MMPLDEYCEWLEDLTIAGDTINGKALQGWIENYAINYHKEQSAITAVAQVEPEVCKHPKGVGMDQETCWCPDCEIYYE